MTEATTKPSRRAPAHPRRSLWRNRVRSFWLDIRWFVLGALTVFTLGLGCVGFHGHFELTGEYRSPGDLLYLSLQLFTLESGSIVPPIPWQLQIARLLAPAIAVYTAVQALLALFHEQLQLLRVRFVKNHVVICGLGQRGLHLAQGFRDRGYRVVVVEHDEDDPLIGSCRERGAIVLMGDARDPAILRKARVHRAAYLVAVCSDDGINTEVAIQAEKLVRSRRGSVLATFIHIEDVELCSLLRERGLASEEISSFRLEFFNILETGARLMLDHFPALERPPGEEVPDSPAAPPHIVVIGLGKMGRSLVVEAGRRWWLRHSSDGSRLRITALDNAADTKKAVLCIRYPQLDRACDITPFQIDLSSIEFERGDFIFAPGSRCDVSIVYLCFDDDVHALAAALSLHQRTREYRIPIIVRMSHDGGLASLMQPLAGGPGTFEDLHAFGMLERACTPELLLSGTHEQLAQAFHEQYVVGREKAGDTPQTNKAMVPWHALPEGLKESNRRQADDVAVKLKAVGCRIMPLADWAQPPLELTREEVELLAKMEHARWCDERRTAGWRYAPPPKNEAKKTSPYLAAWGELDEKTKDIDRDAMRSIPATLARAGFQTYRQR
ncbi:MAG: NAD-binding protein [Acidobacteriota bacterium]